MRVREGVRVRKGVRVRVREGVSVREGVTVKEGVKVREGVRVREGMCRGVSHMILFHICVKREVFSSQKRRIFEPKETYK